MHLFENKDFRRMYIKPLHLELTFKNRYYQGIATVPHYSQHPFSNTIPTQFTVSLNNTFIGIFTLQWGVWKSSINIEQPFVDVIGKSITESIKQSLSTSARSQQS